MRTAYAKSRAGSAQTSLWAADSVTRITDIQQRILRILEDGQPRSDEEIETAYRTIWGNDATSQSLRSRRSELRDQKLIRFAGTYGLTSRNRKTQRWTV